MKIFGLVRRDNETDFYRIVQPLRFLKRNGNDCSTLPYSGNGALSVLPVHDKLLVMLSENADVILTSPINKEDELLRALNLRKQSGAKIVIDVSENIYEVEHTDYTFKSLYLADGLIVSNDRLKDLYKEINSNILVLPSGIDFSDIQEVKPSIDGDYEIIKAVTDKIKIPKNVSLLPLSDNNYTRCLDNIRLIRHCANKTACVSSETYKGFFNTASSNYDWYEAINKLNDKDYKKQVIGDCYKYSQDFDMKKLIKPVKKWLDDLPRKKI